MKRPYNYNTKQREAILAHIASLKGAHVTVNQIVQHFEDGNFSIGQTTIYRHLERLVQEGAVKKYLLDGIIGACYQYIEREDDNWNEHYHLKCGECGELLHVRCDYVDGITSHIAENHDFQVDTNRTIFYGRCSNCRKAD